MSTEPPSAGEPLRRSSGRPWWPLVLQAVTLVVAIVALVFAVIAFNRTQPAHHGKDRHTQPVTTSTTSVGGTTTNGVTPSGT
jgi:hypothetical protein